MKDVVLDHGKARFNYRVGGVALHRGWILLNRSPREDFWYLPGGRIAMGETAAQALKREIREELGVPVRVGPLLWLVENFFRYDGSCFFFR